MLRILKPEGMVLWYDYHMNNPGNPDVRGGKELEKILLLRTHYLGVIKKHYP
jgi:hypothetical protein